MLTRISGEKTCGPRHPSLGAPCGAGSLALDKAADDDRYPTCDHGVQTNSNRRLSNVRRCTGDPVADTRIVEHADASGDDPLRCGLAVKESSGWVRGIQVDFTDGLASRWQGPGVIIRGIVWIGDQGLIWMPRRRVSGARGFELRRDDIERIQVSSVGVRSSGLVVTTSEHGEAWLLLHRSDAATLLTGLDGHDPLGDRSDSA